MRYVVATSTLEDWLYRGSHPVLAPMSFYVYSMWVYRIEKPHRKPARTPHPRFVDSEFATGYALRSTHSQRLATEFRVPLFECYTMSSQNMCLVTAAMFKQLLLKPLSMPGTRGPPDVQFVEAFTPLCVPVDGATAYGRAWLTFASQ